MQWQAGTARLYAVLLIIATAANTAGQGRIFWPTVAAFFLARASKAAWVKRSSFAFSTLNPIRILGAASILAMIDVGTAVGAARWLLELVGLRVRRAGRAAEK